MLVQDMTTGALHQVPDATNFAGYGVAQYPEYSGYGAPYGLFPGLIRTITSPIRRIIGGILPGRRPPVATVRAASPYPRLPYRPPVPFMRRRWGIPPGWQRPIGPYAAHGRSRLYLRCSTWPGPPGLVPPAGAIAPSAGAPRRRRRRRHGGRRRWR